MIRIVVDTNVLVSGLLSEAGAPGRLLDLLLAGELTLLHDPRILAEYRDVVARPELRIDHKAARDVLRFLEVHGEPITARPWPHSLPDDDDEPFLAVAHAGAALCLVTGNLRHYPVAARAGFRVWSPRELLSWLSQHDEG